MRVGNADVSFLCYCRSAPPPSWFHAYACSAVFWRSFHIGGGGMLLVLLVIVVTTAAEYYIMGGRTYVRGFMWCKLTGWGGFELHTCCMWDISVVSALLFRTNN